MKPEVFEEMVEILEQELPKAKQRGGQPKLSIEDQLLITLEYWREYRTYFHIGQSWGIHESTIAHSRFAAPSQRHSLETVQTKGLGRTKFVAEGNRRIVHRVEDRLIKSRKFSLPGKKALSFTEAQWSVVIVDVGESPIERPKKNSVGTIAPNRKGIL